MTILLKLQTESLHSDVDSCCLNLFASIVWVYKTIYEDMNLLVQVEWLRSHIQRVPIRLVFESALELMGTTQIGTFQACFC